LEPDYSSQLDRALKILNALIFISKYLRLIIVVILLFSIAIAGYSFASANIIAGILSGIATLGTLILLLRISVSRPAHRRRTGRIIDTKFSDTAA
jgi:hypothetical protein